jgi:hypothetical protein
MSCLFCSFILFFFFFLFFFFAFFSDGSLKTAFDRAAAAPLRQRRHLLDVLGPAQPAAE